jgi:hypothetical protein
MNDTAPELLVRKRLEEMLAACQASGTRPSVLTLARRMGLTNTTFRRHYPEIAREIAGHRTAPDAPVGSQPNTYDKLVARNAKIRRRNHELTAQLKLAAAQIQYLALRNARLEEALEAQIGVTRIDGRGIRAT